MKKAIIFVLVALLALTGCVNVQMYADEPLPTVAPAVMDAPAATQAPAAPDGSAAMEAPAAPEAPVSATEAPAASEAPVSATEAPAPRTYAFTFTANTLDGETVTEAYFGEHDLTMVNVWASWCGPCRSELSELGELYTKLPENVGFLSVTIDDPADLKDAKALLQQNGCAFSCLDGQASEGLINGFLNQVMAIPTTIFFDRNGNQVGEWIVGVPQGGGSVSDAYLAEIQARLNGK